MRLDERLTVIYETIAPMVTRSEGAWKDYLRFGSTVYKYHFDNALLVYAQNPKATMLATFDTWKDPKINRSINKGEKGIAVCEYQSAKLTMKYLFDVTQTNGKTVPPVWKLDDGLSKGLLNRLSYSKNIKADTLADCIGQIVDNTVAGKVGEYLQNFENDLKGHFLGSLPKDGLIAEIEETVAQSCKYSIAARCGIEAGGIEMPAIPHFDTIPLVQRLGYTVTELSKGILLEIERSVKILESERSAQHGSRNSQQPQIARTPERLTAGEPATRRGTAPRQVRQDGNGTPAQHQPPKVFTFEDAGTAFEPDVPGGRGSDGTGGKPDPETLGERPDAAGRGHHGADAPPEHAEGHRGGNRDPRDGADTEITTEPEREPQGSFSLPGSTGKQQAAIGPPSMPEPKGGGEIFVPAVDDEAVIKAELLYGSGFDGGKRRIRDFLRKSSPTAEFAESLKNEYGIGGHSGIGDGVIYAGHNSAGIQIRVRDDGSETGERTIKLTWSNAAKRIAELVNEGEYLPEQQGSPLWRQYDALLHEYPDSIVFKRLGDFYEAMGWDANTVAKELGFTVKSRDVGLTERVPVIGIPARALDTVVKELVKRDYSVVLSDADGVTEYPSEPEQPDEENGLDGYAIPDEPESYGSTARNESMQLAFDSEPGEQMRLGFGEQQTAKQPEPEPVSKKKVPSDTPHRNYRAFCRLFPQIADETYRYLRLESEGYEPLSIEQLHGGHYSIMHTFVQNGGLMRDPDMVIAINHDGQTVQALSYELSGMGVYQDVYASGSLDTKLQRDLNSFLSTWLKNISEQGFTPSRAVSAVNGADVEGTFDEDNSPISAPGQGQPSEAKIPPRLYNETLNAHNGQIDCRTEAFIGNGRVGTLHYSVFEGVPQISLIEVEEDYRRRGIATAMVQGLAKRYPGAEIEWGMLTDAGAALKEAVTYTVENGEYNEAVNRLAEINGQLTKYDATYTAGVSIPDDVSEEWYALDDEKYGLENRLNELKPVRTFVKQPADTALTEPAVGAADFSGGTAEPTATAAPELKLPKPVPAGPDKHNYRYSEADNLFTGGAKTKFRSNIEAIRLVKTLEAEGRLATPTEQKILANYVGWGGLAGAFSAAANGWANEYQELKLILDEEEYDAARKSTITAFYTEPKIAQAMYKAMARFGFEGGNRRTLLEPALGTGNFFSVLPEEMQDTNLVGVELDSISGRIARQLYQNADISVQGFETAEIEDGSVDVVIGNIPFNSIKVFDKRYEEENFLIHDYFIAKSLDLLKPGGIMAVITSKGTMDKRDTSAREYFAKRADLIGAVRLPNNAFTALSGTEVTADILFFQKLGQIREAEKSELPDWVRTDTRGHDYLRLNQYFIDNPDMILGEMEQSRNMYGSEDGTACLPREGQGLYAELEVAVGRLMAVFKAQPDPEPVMRGEEEPDEEQIKADAGTKQFTYVIKDGRIYFCDGRHLIPQGFKGVKAERVKGLCAIRSALLDVVAVQSRDSGYQPDELEAAQKTLNVAYDGFVKQYGYINDKANILAFSNDDQSPLLRSIEDLNEDKATYSKAPIFTKATIKSYRQPDSAGSAKEALEISLNMKLKVDLMYMSQLYGKVPDEIIAELGDRIYLNPRNYYGNPYQAWETAEEYLSGDVVAKLDYAKLKAVDNEMFARNVAALEAVQPVKLLPSDIDFRIGSPWIPIGFYRQFMYEAFETSAQFKPSAYGGYYDRDGIELEYLEYTDSWNIAHKYSEPDSVKVNQTYGTKRVNAYEIYEDCFNLQATTVRDPVKYTDRGGKEQTKYVINAAETMIARSKQQQMKEAFAGWLFADKDRAEALLSIYNERFNRIRPREYDGSHLRFDGMSEERELRPHQKNVVARIVYHGTCLMAHEVGAGKTAAMIAAGMYMRNMGVIKKPIYVVPNHLTEQWAKEFYRFFPSANILVTTKADFEKKNRHRFVSKIAMGDYDAVIIGHSQFEKIPISKERQERQLNEEIVTLTRIIQLMKEENGEMWAIKKMEIFKENLRTRLQRLIDEERKDDLLDFEQLGVDYLFVDEAHAYKNAYTYSKMRNVAGIGQSKSQRAADMGMKCQYLQEINKGRGVTFATGTPISNSMSEMFVMQQYLQPDVLKKAKLHFFDKWAATFGDTVSSLEINPEGSGYRIKSRFSKFHNLPELMNMFRTVADIQTADMLNLPTPEIEGGKAQVIVTKRSEFQKKIMDSFVTRAERIRSGSVAAEEDNMLKLTNEAKLMAIDPRLVYPDAPNDPDSKLNTSIRYMFDIWKETAGERLTQVVFCDSGTPKAGVFNVYDEVKGQLISMGVPAHEIAFVHDAKNDAQREAMFEKTRKGEIRILLGSTAKLGTGTNIQKKLCAMYHLDVPWRPSDIIQRDGRGLRFGNENKSIKIFRFVTKDTFDAYLWQIQEQKLRYITQIMTGKSVSRSCEDVDETVLTAAEIKAIATSNPLLAEKMTVDNEVTRLKLLKGSYTNERLILERNINSHYPDTVTRTEKRIADIQSDIAVLEKHRDGDFMIEVDGRLYDERTKAGEALLTVIAAKCTAGEGQCLVGKFRGLEIHAERKNFADIDIRIVGGARYTTPTSDSALGNITRIENLAERLPGFLAEAETKLDDTRRQLATAQKAVEKPFEYEEKLSEYLTRQTEINMKLEFKELSKQQDAVLSEANASDAADEDEMEGEYENDGLAI